ncbi:hypothetical protein ACFY1B_46525 [Streptomyces mirabilis]|uniref:hypothetical protein n=1 Tax=Streptomyces mirabilis TaxID=68239 RepID=UPI003696E1B4
MEMSLARLKEALNRAVARRLVAANVAQEVTIPRKVRKAERRAKAVVQPWNVEEVHAFVRAVKDDRLYAALLLTLPGRGIGPYIDPEFEGAGPLSVVVGVS